ncbi:type II toxin-antitoxin system RelE/ParE family toxin [Propylenella binzhouense]|uniref:Plasmid maintenance system killer protein n=1 Tax=Propylenella binzhouense TaxID=2555902 RepID=A0A964T603_9HYPH|nr:plasmid maintenance system killer protein [Propylenella binzhouense]
MIRSFRSRALRRFWERSDERRLPAEQAARIAMILDRLDASTQPGMMNVPGLRFHSLTGDMKGRYAVAVTGNWRITFAWDGEDAVAVDLEDYH